MEKYSHDTFQVTGYKITTTNKGLQSRSDIGAAWAKFLSEDMANKIEHKAYPGVHVVYFNYVNPQNTAERGYDMLIGFLTEAGSAQRDDQFTTITIPAQDYEYVEVKGEMPMALIEGWKTINALSPDECRRAFEYDLDMYNEDRSGATITVSVK